jgi:Tfp pilus assembly protein FimT
MNLPQNISSKRRTAGVLLIECIVYIAVFAILLGIGTASFYFCWDHTKALIYATDDIASALRAGERWRADVRAATGKIGIETTAAGEVVRIPESDGQIVYRFGSGELRREISTMANSQLLLPKVKSSRIEPELRGGVAAWRWELELAERRKETHLPLRFTFEAAQTKP